MAEDNRESSAGRDAKGHFAKGNRFAPGGRRDHSSRVFRAWLQAYFEKPETKRLIREKCDRDLKGDGPATFAIRMHAYVYGEPRQIIEFEVKRQAEKLAEDAGIDSRELIAAAEQLVANAVPN